MALFSGLRGVWNLGPDSIYVTHAARGLASTNEKASQLSLGAIGAPHCSVVVVPSSARPGSRLSRVPFSSYKAANAYLGAKE
jgi:hypothetical protein